MRARQIAQSAKCLPPKRYDSTLTLRTTEKHSMEAHIYNSSTGEVDTKSLGLPGQSRQASFTDPRTVRDIASRSQGGRLLKNDT